MRILIDARPLLEVQPTGVSVYARELLTALFQNDTTNDYFLYINCAKDSVAARMPVWHQPNVHVVRTRWPSKLLHACIVFLKWPHLNVLVEKRIGKSIDIVVSLNPHFTALSPTVPFLLTVHDVSIAVDRYFFSPYERLWHRLVQLPRLLARAHTIFSVSYATKKDLEDLYQIPAEKITVLAPGVPSTTQHPTQTPIPSHKKIIILGTRARRKNIANALRAFAMVHRRHPDTELVLVGNEGYGWDEAAPLLKELEIEKSVQIIGYADEQTKQALLHSAAVSVYPSFYEGFGLPILEAFREGAPVVTSLGSSLQEAGGAGALYCNPWRPDMIACAISSIFTDGDLRTTLIEAGREQLTRFSWGKSAQLLKQTIESYAHRH